MPKLFPEGLRRQIRPMVEQVITKLTPNQLAQERLCQTARQFFALADGMPDLVRADLAEVEVGRETGRAVEILSVDAAWQQVI
mgnify:CR=1 FL=1